MHVANKLLNVCCVDNVCDAMLVRIQECVLLRSCIHTQVPMTCINGQDCSITNSKQLQPCSFISEMVLNVRHTKATHTHIEYRNATQHNTTSVARLTPESELTQDNAAHTTTTVYKIVMRFMLHMLRTHVCDY